MTATATATITSPTGPVDAEQPAARARRQHLALLAEGLAEGDTDQSAATLTPAANEPDSPSRRRKGPVTLPAAPLVAAVKAAASAQDSTILELFGGRTAAWRAFYRADRQPHVSLKVVDQLCGKIDRHPSEVYGPAYETASVQSLAGRPARSEVGQRRATTAPLATYQAIWAAMQATAQPAADGNGLVWTGHLPDLVSSIDPAPRYRSVYRTMTSRRWIRCERQGARNAHSDKPGALSVWRLLRAPAADTRKCDGDGCDNLIVGVDADGYLTQRLSRYCCDLCRYQGMHAAYGRELDRVRRAAGLPVNGQRNLTFDEIRDIVAEFRRLRMRAA